MIMEIMRVLEEYGKWKAEVLTTYGLDSKEAARLSGEIADRLKRLGFRIPIIHTGNPGWPPSKEKLYHLSRLVGRTYVARIR